MNAIIPSNNSDLQQALTRLTNDEIAKIFDLQVIAKNRDPKTCQQDWLPWLAWERSIGSDEGWNISEQEINRRQIVDEYIKTHQHKGTPSVIRKLFKDLGFGDVEIIENASDIKWDGKEIFEGTHIFGGNSGDWAKYSIKINRAVTNKEASKIREWLGNIAPLRCELLNLDYRNSPIYWDGEIKFDGSYNFGAA
ncbi:MAG: phage tail protein I [Neisseria sp.]|nr:MAG: phage tail protein I [Neisseria sp.]